MYSLFDKFLNNCLTDTEVEELRDLLQEKKYKIAFESFLRNQRDTYEALQEINFQEAYNAILNGIDKPKVPVKLFYRQWFKYAAILIAILGTTYGVYFINTNQNNSIDVADAPLEITLELEDGSIKTLNETASETIVNLNGKKVVSHQQNTLLYSNDKISDKETLVYNQLNVPYGRKFQIVLSDGTQVFLNSGSSLRYPTKFISKMDRDVYLDGEAYFIVKRDVNHPFTVITEQMNTRVLGTKFNVSSYKNENITAAVLVSGAIGVYNSSENYTPEILINVVPGQRAIFKTDTIEVEHVNVQKYIAWTEGKLFFIDDRFDTILKELERNFNVSISNTYASLNQEFFTGTFETETLDEILKAFQAHTAFNYTINGDTIMITK